MRIKLARHGPNWIAIVLVALFFGVSLGCIARAEGVFVPAPNRVDIVYDDTRGVLYISQGAQLLRFQLSTQAFLAPLTYGGSLSGLDISADGTSLVAADVDQYGGQPCIHIVDLAALTSQLPCFTASFDEGGSFTAAYGSDGSILVTTQFLGSGWVPLRRYVPSTGVVTTLGGEITQNSMLRASADHTVIAIAQSNISNGPFGGYLVAIGMLTPNSDTNWFDYEIAISPDKQQYAVPTYGGTFFADASLTQLSTVIGTYAGGQPVGVAYNPVNDSVYFPWAGTSEVYVYDRTTLTKTGSLSLSGTFGQNGNFAFVNGRVKTSNDGRLLFVTVDGGVRYLTLDPLAPTGLTAAPLNGVVNLAWSAVPNATSYNVYQGTASGAETLTPVATGITGTSLSISSLANGTKYYFTVATVAAAGTSTPSDEASATPEPPPPAVSGLTAAAGNGQVTLAWTGIPIASSYTVYQGTQSGGEVAVATGLTTASYTTGGLTNGTTYYFEVRASNPSGTGPQSSEVSATPLSPPAAPTDLVVTAGDGAVTLQWSASARAITYSIYVSTSSGAELNSQPISTTSGMSQILTGLANGVTYYFVVTSVNGSGQSTPSNEVIATPAGNGAGGAPVAVYDPSTRQLSISSVIIGNATYSDVVITVSEILTTPSGSNPYGNADTYNPANNHLIVQSVTVGSTAYYNAVVAAGNLVSIGNVSGADTYSPGNNQLSIAAVNVLGGSTYKNVVITVGSIIGVGHGMPSLTQDVYIPESKQLLVPAVEVNGKVYTNVVITVGTIVLVGS